MEANKTTREAALVKKADVPVAISAAPAANCIPCFEHLYEKAVTFGIPAAEEGYLLPVHKDSYPAYKENVPRYLLI